MKTTLNLYKKQNYIVSDLNITYKNFLVFNKNIYNVFYDYIKHDIWNYFK